MSTLDRRDIRRARAVIKMIEAGTFGVTAIAHALKRERDETGMGAINWFLFGERGTKESTKRAIAQKYCKRKHLDKRGKA